MPTHPNGDIVNHPAAVYPPIHGHAVMIRIPSVRTDNHDVVLVDRREGHDRYVTGLVSANDQIPTEWFWGNYFDDLRTATIDLLER